MVGGDAMRAKEAAFLLQFGKKGVQVRIPNSGRYEVKRIYQRQDGQMTIVLGRLIIE
jgi:hypothetical protein